MSGFTKLHESILDSTVWREADTTRLVWITMLAMVDARGVVDASVPGLADRARVSLQDCQHALDRLLSPDLSVRRTWTGEHRSDRRCGLALDQLREISSQALCGRTAGVQAQIRAGPARSAQGWLAAIEPISRQK